MKTVRRHEFPLSPDIIQLNHASYGIASREVLKAAERLRAHIESDPTRYLGAELTDNLRTQTRRLATALDLDEDRITLCGNATSGAAAIIASLPLGPGDTVVVLDTEYSSIRRAWEIACARSGARCLTVPVSLPLGDFDSFAAALDAHVPGSVTYLQASLISSSAAIRLPVAELSTWVRGRGGQLIVDAAHGPGHVEVQASEWDAAAMFGTLHKWLPAMRSVGFLWLAPQYVDMVRPAEVSLTWDSPDLVERFSWPGTFDPVPRLCLDVALLQWQQWRTTGRLAECERLADCATEVLTGPRTRPTTARRYLPPRMRCFILEGVTVAQVKAALSTVGVRAWVGPGPNGECLLRISTHVYNDNADIDLLAHTLQEVLTR